MVIIHCMHSKKRGPKCAAKLQERIIDTGISSGPEVYVKFIIQFHAIMMNNKRLYSLVLEGGYGKWHEEYAADSNLIES